MKLKNLITSLVAVLLSASAAFAQTTIAQWTFESLPSTFSYAPGASVATTNFYAEQGAQAGTAALTGWHYGFGTVTYSSPAGDPGRSLSSSGWTNSAAASSGDYYQAKISTIGFQNIGLSFNQYSSGTGPGRFYVAYSTDGSTFTQFGSIYNSGNGVWITNTVDLSSITALNNQATVYIRLVDANNTSANGGTVGTGGTCRIDNFTVTGLIPGAPTIATQPQNINAFKGDSVTFSVVAGGSSPLVYQWYYTNSTGTNMLVDGPTTYGAITNSATNSSVTLTYVNTTQAGGYFVVVTNAIGSITSSVASLTVGIRTPITTSIYAIRTNQTANWTPADTTNLYTVTGTVYTAFNMTGANSREFYIEDASGEGIPVFVGGGTFLPNQGDSVTVTGPIGQYNGLLEFNLSASNPTHSVVDNSSGNPLPVPKYFNLNWLTNIAYVETNIEGSLVVVSNVFLQNTNYFISGADVIMTNANGVKLNLFVNAGASDVIASSVPHFASSIVGLFGQYTTASPATNSYELDILQYAGLVAGSPVTANTDSFSMASNTTSVFPVLANDTIISPLYEGSLTVTTVSSDSGVAAIDSTGTNVTLTPAADFLGTVTISYTATDTAGYTANGVATVTVTNVPPAPSTIVPTVPPAITSFNLTNSNIVITGTNAQATGIYYLLATTNLALPRAQWTPVATNVVSTANAFTFIGTNVVAPGIAQQFYLLSSTNNR